MPSVGICIYTHGKYGGTRTEVVSKMNESIEKINNGSYIDESNVLLENYLDERVEIRKKKIKPTTYDTYKINIDVHIKPILGRFKLKDIERKHLQELYELKFEKGRINGDGGLKTASIAKIHNILNTAFNEAILNGLVVKNPCQGAIIPKSPEEERRVLSKKEQKMFIEILAEERLKAAFMLEMATGIRIGETLALTWDDVNLEQKYLVVRKTLARIRNPKGVKPAYILHLQEPKTEKSKRMIPLPEFIVKDLKEYKIRQELEKKEAGDVYEDNNIVFSTSVGTYIIPRNFMRTFYSLCKRANIPHANVHSLRHTFATRMLELGENVKVVQEILGHKNVSQTLDTYTHVLEDTKRKAMKKVDNLMDELNLKD